MAVVGPTGAGKSTIAALATRLMDPAGGRILLGGVELPKLSDESLAGTVALDPTRGELAITGSLTIDGPGANRLTVSGGNASRVFSISGSSTNVAIDDLTIADGLAAGTTMMGPTGPVTPGGGVLRATISRTACTDSFANCVP